MPPRRFALPRPPMTEKANEATHAANPNQKKAVEAWASRQRFSVLGEPFVMWFVVVYAYITH
jgi:hypothetical protein